MMHAAAASLIREPYVKGWAAICAVLADCGWPLDRFAAARLSLRRVKPLPVDGPSGAPFSFRSVLITWVDIERRRCGRSLRTEQLPLFSPGPHNPHNPHGAHSPHNR